MEVLLPTPESLISEFKPSFISFDENWARGLVAPNIRSWGLISNILLFFRLPVQKELWLHCSRVVAQNGRFLRFANCTISREKAEECKCGFTQNMPLILDFAK